MVPPFRGVECRGQAFLAIQRSVLCADDYRFKVWGLSVWKDYVVNSGESRVEGQLTSHSSSTIRRAHRRQILSLLLNLDLD